MILEQDRRVPLLNLQSGITKQNDMVLNIFIILTILGLSHQSDVDTGLLRQLLVTALDKHLPEPRRGADQDDVRSGKQIQSADPGAIMFLPIGGSGNIRLN